MTRSCYIIYDANDPYELPCACFDWLYQVALWLGCTVEHVCREMRYKNFIVEKVDIS